MATGVELQLFDGASNVGTLDAVQIAWFDEEQPKDFAMPRGSASGITLEASGWLKLDLSNVTNLAVGESGFLVVYKLDGTDHEDSPVFAGKLTLATITSGVLVAPTNPWVRPSSWLALTTLTESDQKFEGLHAVYEFGSNFVALSAEGNYTVNWGDGSGNTNVNSGVTAEKNIAWADATNTTDVGIADAVSCTFQDTGDTVTVTAHTFKNGERVAFNSITSTTGISTYTTYFVRDAAADTFKVESTIGGGALALTTDGSGSVYRTKYRQVIVSVVPNAVNLTKLNLHIKHSQSGLQTYTSGFLDIVIAGQYLTDLRLGVPTPGSTIQTIRFGSLEQINVVRSDLRQLEHLLYNAYNLRNVKGFATSTTAAASNACTFQDTGDTVTWNDHGFRNGDAAIFTAITSTTGITIGTRYFVVGATTNTFQVATTYGGAALPLTTNGSGTVVRGTNFSTMFNGCYALTSVPLFNTSAGTSFSSMFQNCYSLTSVSLFDTSAGTSFSTMFQNCYALTSVPLFNTSAGTNFSTMLNSCYSLTSVPLFDTSACTTFSYMFGNCYTLASVPLFDTSACTTFSSMFGNCYTLASVPLFNTSACTTFSNMFSGCYALTSVPLFNTSAGTNFSNMVGNCYALTSVPLFDTSAGTTFSFMFSSCPELSSARLAGTPVSISYANCKLSAAALDDIYTGLKSGVTGQTITVTNNWGVAGDDPTIATGKGWSVTG